MFACLCVCVSVCVYNCIGLDHVPLVYLRMLHFQPTDQSDQSFSGLIRSVHVGWCVVFSEMLVGSGLSQCVLCIGT